MKNKDAIKTCLSKDAFLLGNGINRVNDGRKDRYEWGNLLFDLNNWYADDSILNIRKKPFPMVYDEIVSYSLKRENKSESYIKTFIKDKIEKIESNDRYKNIHEIKQYEILTTNYDYLIEKAIDENWKRSPINKLEYLYSIYRFQNTSHSRVWHIHGEQADSRSLLLGFRHYMNYASKVKSRAELFIGGLKINTIHNNDSWVDLFFTHNIKIIGLGMLFTEYPIWWLLAYRNQIITSNPNIDINNKITFLLPSFLMDEENQNIIDMLKAYSVECIMIDVKDFDSFYEKVLLLK